MKHLPFKAFRERLKIPADFDPPHWNPDGTYYPGTQKLGSTYVDEYHETWIYSTLCSAETSLVLEPLVFQISSNEFYIDLYNEMQGRHKGLYL